MRRSSCGTFSLVLATCLGPVAIALLAVSFATDYWIEFTVDRNRLGASLKTDATRARYTFTRNRGIFRECYYGNDTDLIFRNADGIVDSNCFHISYKFPETTNVDYSADFSTRIHLMRCHMAFFIMALVFFLISYVFGAVVCCWRRSKWAYCAGFCAYFSAFCTAAAIAFFHGAEYLERNKIRDEPQFYQAWDPSIKTATVRDYRWSYILGWVGMGVAALTATLYAVAGCYIGSERYEDKDYLEKRRGREYGYQAYDNRAFPMELAYPDPYAYPPPHRAGPYPGPPYYPGPYVYDMDTRRPLPAVGYGGEQGAPYWTWSG
ncbi:uncharacterized protein [Mytilus edulis]|uniref:uncharacterized protein n=1 Tax=Mytilus edulis TaxID=6550 RepID=UPI0039EEDE7B